MDVGGISNMRNKEWYRIVLFYYSSKNPITVTERLYSSYGRAYAAARMYAKRYECCYLVKQLTFNDMSKYNL